MQLDKRISDLVSDTAGRLSTSISILDETGEVLLSSNAEQVGTVDEALDSIEFDQSIVQDIVSGNTYILLENENYRPLRVRIDGLGKEVENYAFFLNKLIEEILKTTIKKPGREEVYRRILLDRIDPLEMQDAVRDYKIDPNADRCVIIIQTINGESTAVHQILNKIFRMQEGDMVVSLNRYVVALVKMVDEESDMESLRELVLALDETIHSEITMEAYLGVGSIKSGLLNIRDSFTEAQEAINLGLMQQNNSRIFMFHKLLLERFLQTVPRDIRKQFHELAYTDTLKKVLNEEMLSTVLTFFENNLNLSEAARKLYIHRNTLIYRLEKIQRLTGLDLRNFDDAILLRIIIMLGKSLSSNNRME